MKILAICGSLRTESLNRLALNQAVSYAAEAGHQVIEADLKELDLPNYNQDVEDAGMPDKVTKFKNMVVGADVILIASPEYNHSVPGVLKNAIDWASRGGNSFDSKVAAIFSASPGRLGGSRGQAHLRDVLEAVNVKMLNVPEVMISGAHEAYNEDGSFKDPKTGSILQKLVLETIKLAE